MIMISACKLICVFILLGALSLLAAGCAGMTSGKGTYTSDRDAQAFHEMEWNYDPWR
jgi:hypothetical protein